MGFEACHPAVNFIFFAAAIYGAVSFKHPVFLAIAYVCAFAYSVKRRGKRAVIFDLCLLPLILAFALYYSSYHHFGVTILKKNFIGNNITFLCTLFDCSTIIKIVTTNNFKIVIQVYWI